MPKASGWHRKRSRTPGELAGRYRSSEHRAAQRQVQALAAAGLAVCWRCGTTRASQWHAGHSDDGLEYMGPECRRCNITAAASKGARIVNAKRKARGFVRPVR